MKTFVIKDITVNCLFAELSEEQQKLSKWQKEAVERYKKLQENAVQYFFNDKANLKKFQDAKITSVDVDSRVNHIQHVREHLVQLPMGLVLYHPLLATKIIPPKDIMPAVAVPPRIKQEAKLAKETIESIKKKSIVVKKLPASSAGGIKSDKKNIPGKEKKKAGVKTKSKNKN